MPFAGVADYSGTKAAIAGYARGVARDLGGRGITVNVVQPGVMPTDMSAEVLGESVPEELMNLHPIRRIATLEEVSALVCFLAGPHGGYMTDVVHAAGHVAAVRPGHLIPTSRHDAGSPGALFARPGTRHSARTSA